MSVTRRLVSPVTSASAPFCFAQPFAQGECPVSVVCAGATSYQVTVLRRWRDGSVKHASISGFASITASTTAPFQSNPTTLTLSAGTPPTGTNLTAADIATAAPTASVQCGALGTVNLSALLATPFATFQSGPQMVEALYRGFVGGGTQLSVFFYVRMWLGGRVEIEASVENSYLDNGAGGLPPRVTETYIPTVTIGGTVIYTNGGVALSHGNNSTWSQMGWVGGDPQVTPLHDPTYLMASKLVPNYDRFPPAEGTLNGSQTTYVPLNSGQWRVGMGGTGFHEQIGLLPNWDALCCTSGDIRAFKSSETNARALRSYGISYKDKTTGKAVKPSLFPTWTLGGNNGSGSDSTTVNGLTWEQHHHGSCYLAYLLTGRPIHLDTMAMQTSLCWLCTGWSYGRGSGLNRRIVPPQTRGVAWHVRTYGQYAAIAPTNDDVAAEYRTVLENSYAYFHTLGPSSANTSRLGYILDMGSYAQTSYVAAPWMQHFWMQANGHVLEADPGFTTLGTTKLSEVTKWMYKAIVGILDATGASNFHFTKAESYTITIGPVATQDGNGFTFSNSFYDTWGEVYQNTFGVANNNTSNTLENQGGLDPFGYWANLKPAAAMAAEQGVPGGAAAWARLTGATNSTTFLQSTFNNTPIFGIGPRAIITIAPDGGVAPITPTAGRSTRIETVAMMAARTQVGNAGMGLLGSEIATTGTSGPAYIYGALVLPADANYEVSGEITRFPTNGTLTTYEDGSFSYTGATDYFLWLLKVGGIPSTDNTLGYGPGISRVDLVVGGSAVAPGAPTGVSATAGNAQATVTGTAPANNGGSAILNYTATGSPGGSATGSLPLTVTGLTIGVAHTFTLHANNAVGAGPESSPSNAVTPTGGTAATAITLSGPSTGVVGVASTNFTVGANGVITGTVIVTPSSGGGGGTFTPTTVSISAGSPTATFKYTPSSTGAKTISITNSGGLTNPASRTYTSNAAGVTYVPSTRRMVSRSRGQNFTSPTRSRAFTSKSRGKTFTSPGRTET